MGFFRRNFRIWWQKPRKIEDVEEDRRVSPLELFYDLAFVGIIYQITHSLVEDLTMWGVFEYGILFAMIYSAWVNGTLYHELHGNNDIRTRVFMFLQVFALTFMGIFAPTAFGDGANGFALGYTAFMMIVTWLWISTGISDSRHRTLAIPYWIGYGFVILSFVLSFFFPAPLKFLFWFFGAGLTLFVPIIFRLFVRGVDPEYQEASVHIHPALVERFGQLMIIVLGEAVASIMRAASYHAIVTNDIIILVFLSLGIITGMWWAYFDLVSGRVPVQKNAQRMAWMYLHFPLTLSVGLMAVGLFCLLEYPENVTSLVHWLIIGSIVVFLLCLKILIYTLQVEHQFVYRRAGELSFFAAITIFLIGFLYLPMVWTLTLSIILMLFPVFGAVHFWVAYQVSQKKKGG